MKRKTAGIPDIEELLLTERSNIELLNDIVSEAIEEEKLLSNKLSEFDDKHPPLSSRMADKVAQFAGSWKFILSFLLLMSVWMLVNTVAQGDVFDPYPFILLNLLLSTVAAIQAPLIIMSQNRKEEKDRQRAINDYMVNLKSEIEIRNLHQKLDLLMSKQISTLFEVQKVQEATMKEIKALISNERGGRK